MSGNTGKVYKLTFPDGKVYIGKTVNSLKQRLANGYNSQRMKKAFENCAMSDVKKEILVDGLGEREVYWVEMDMIIKHKSYNPKYGYNTDVSRFALAESIKSLEKQPMQSGRNELGPSMSVHEISVLQDVMEDTVRQWIYCGKLEAIKTREGWQISSESYNEFCDRCEIGWIERRRKND